MSHHESATDKEDNFTSRIQHIIPNTDRQTKHLKCKWRNGSTKDQFPDKANHKITRLNLLQFRSSLLSPQSFRLSHLHWAVIQCPLSHWNSFGLHVRLSQSFSSESSPSPQSGCPSQRNTRRRHVFVFAHWKSESGHLSVISKRDGSTFSRSIKFWFKDYWMATISSSFSNRFTLKGSSVSFLKNFIPRHVYYFYQDTPIQLDFIVS